jgi:uncharacterized glyoxalase superfamily protein PhnB/SAM-dependent methyltransferase
MTDDLEPLRRSRPDRLLPDDPPDPEILARGKARLMSAITGPDGAVEHRRTPSIYPRLAYRDEVAAVEFLTRVFGLVERRESRMELSEGMLAWLEIGDGVVMIGRAGEERHGLHSPLEMGAPTAMVNVYVHDIDTHYRRAESEGAQIVTPLEDMFWGDRRYEALDLEGHRWHFAERVSEIPARPAGQPSSPNSVPRASPHSAEAFNDSYTNSTPAPWDIGRPQPAFARLAQAGALVGRVLDVGCGTGEHALLAASLGNEALGVDMATRAIELARVKADARGIEATFLVFDALRLPELDTQFDTVLDCGLFHGFDDHERRRFVDGLAAVVRPGGRYHMLCFSDRQPGDWGPRRVTEGEIRASFAEGWTVDSIDPTVLDITIDPARALAWQVVVTRR